MPHCKYAPQSVLGNSNNKLYYDRYIITDRPVYNNRLDRVILDKPSKKHARTHIHTHTHTTMPNSHNLPSTITQKLLKYTDLKEDRFRIWQLNTTYVLPSVLPTTGIIPNKLHEGLKPLNLLPALYILIQKAVTLNI